MNTSLVFSLIGSAGFLAGIAALFHFFNTRKATRTKGSAEAYQAYREFTTGAFDDHDKELARVVTQRDLAYRVRDGLIDLVQESFRFLRQKGATFAEMEPLEDRLDALRRL